MNPLHIFIALSFVFGALIGSFLNVVVWRIPRGQSVVHPPSACPRCGHRIRPWENIPIISWLCLRARCSGCHLPISWMYPAGEAAVGALYAAIFCNVYFTGLPLETLLPWWWFAGSMLSAARIDAAHRMIPNKITYTGIAAALLIAALLPFSRPVFCQVDSLRFGTAFAEPLIAWLAGLEIPGALRIAAVADVLLGVAAAMLIPGVVALLGNALCRWYARSKGAKKAQVALGWGDVKLMAMTGALLGADSVVYILAGGAMLGGIWGALKMTVNPEFRQSPSLPLAPFLAVPALVWVIAGNWLAMLIRLAMGNV